jgi:hypothetical protein
MAYKAKNIDTDKALEYLKEVSRDSYGKQHLEEQKIKKYYEGYRDGISIAQNMFYCSNYEKEGIKDENI